MICDVGTKIQASNIVDKINILEYGLSQLPLIDA
jgi:hypothetical protein